ncbi:MAG: DUF308 domain-containing protein [Oscillospiraceae bacterium]|nr:DUF308 domain-containing protein [Oscillospiraceae bacterium]
MFHSKILTGKILLCICEILVGILLLIDPEAFTTAIITGLGLILFALGAISVFSYFRTPPAEAQQGRGLVRGLCAILGGMFCIFRSNWFVLTFPLLTMMYGVSILFIGLTRVQWAVDMLRMKRERWPFAMISAAISVTAGTVILLDPFGAAGLLWRFVAIALLVEALVDLGVMIFMHRSGDIFL